MITNDHIKSLNSKDIKSSQGAQLCMVSQNRTSTRRGRLVRQAGKTAIYLAPGPMPCQ